MNLAGVQPTVRRSRKDVPTPAEPGSEPPSFLGSSDRSHTGTVHRLCRPAFADDTTVRFPPRVREKVPRLRTLPLGILEPVE